MVVVRQEGYNVLNAVAKRDGLLSVIEAIEGDLMDDDIWLRNQDILKQSIAGDIYLLI